MFVFGMLVAVALAGTLYQLVGAARDRRRFAPPGFVIDVGGHGVHAVCRGEGTPVVALESGIAASSISWSLVQPAVATFTQVCASDRAGLAWSDLPSCPGTFAGIVGDFAAVLSSCGARPDRAGLVGRCLRLLRRSRLCGASSRACRRPCAGGPTH